ncbi:hypothetical protein PN498_11495 [Oscillatoria sp. CS-180]|uniref:hypothetical protein n=1 Tax=Oscillatoria sp. CS-180 TaxID=3021720 RepID=UPI00232E7C67|nr:hypothetical protein [Oscillatoria sp. CS-180]MDB9526617.1 hypothetical protein [Oscillatoria sp. CS-180]
MSRKLVPISTAILIGTISSWGAVSLASSPKTRVQTLQFYEPSFEVADVILAQSRVSPPVPPLPSPLPTATPPTESGIVGLSPEPTDDIGVGHLRPRDLSFLETENWTDSPYLGANWLQAAAIPIYTEPDGSHWGWIISGWLVPNGQEPLALGRDASFSMLHTYYSLFSFPVTQIQDDGWFEFQYTPAGKAWAHVDHLNLGRIDLAVETWENRFLDMGWVEFRNHGLSQSLKAVPDDSATILGLVGPDSFIETLAFDGDWMQVRVTQPTSACQQLPGAVTQEGWMRWRNSEQQSLIWFPPKGC